MGHPKRVFDMKQARATRRRFSTSTKKVSLFASLSADHLLQLARGAHEKKYTMGEVVCAEGGGGRSSPVSLIATWKAWSTPSIPRAAMTLW